MRKQLAALAVLFLLAHIFFLPPTLEDIDSINFAIGVRDFDVAKHQPHPPGYPVFIGLAKPATALLRAAGVPSPEPRALALLSVLSGTALIPLLFALYRRIEGDESVALAATLVVSTAPLLWFTAVRPLSDVTGLAFATAAQVLLMAALVPRATAARAIVIGGLLTGLAAGVRVQTVMLTAPLFAAALVWRSGVALRDRAIAVAAAAVGVLIWGVPLIAASGGLGGYLAALGTQAGEDFSGVVMLWTTREPRVAVDAVLYSFVEPWGVIGLAVSAAALVGLIRVTLRSWRSTLVAAIAFAPYAVFHLLFHETVTVRYALPLMVPVAFFAVSAFASARRQGVSIAFAALLMAAGLVQSVPAVRAYARDGSPAFRAFAAAEAEDPAVVLAMHGVMRRVEEWQRGRHAHPTLPAPHGREWLALVDHWRNNPSSMVAFLADPRRTDLVLFDPRSRVLESAERWTFPEMPFVGGTRPGAIDRYRMRPPGWMLEQGWALTAEVGGVTARQGLGPHIQPSVAWVRGRADAATLIVGGRNLGGANDAAVRLTLAGPRGVLATWDAPPGAFYRELPLEAGALAGDGYLPLRVSAQAADDSGRAVRAALEQFDLQSEGVPMLGLQDGWYEPEYNPRTAVSWRWVAERAMVWVRPVGRDVTLTLRGESPLRYFDRAPVIRVTAGGSEVTRFSPSDDFTQAVTLPAALLQSAGGRVVVESDLWFSPAERAGAADQRHLAMRIYSADVR